MILSTALLCLAATIFHEARGETVIGRHAVAQVVMNRADRDPKNVCQVVAARKQFSWANTHFGLARRVDGQLVLTKKGLPKDQFAWDTAIKIATVALNGRMIDFTQGARFYHVNAVHPIWRKKMQLAKVIGNHRFYRLI